MKSLRSLLATAACALALAFTSSVGTAHAAEPTPAAPGGDLVELFEFKTTNNAGYFYTTNRTEAAQATSVHKFAPHAGNGVIGKLHSRPVPGGWAVHRLRLRDGGPSYMLSISSEEFRNPKFQDEGIIGYTDAGQKSGQIMLMRFSNQDKWRAFPNLAASVQDLKSHGWSVDGPLGWIQS